MKNVEIKLWKLMLAVAIVTAGLIWLVIHMVNLNRGLTATNERNEAVLYTYDIVVNDMREKVAERKLLVAETQRLLKLSRDQVERLKEQNIRNVYAIGQLKLQLQAVRDSLPLSRDSIRVPVEQIPASNVSSTSSIWDMTADGAEQKTRPMVEVPLRFGWEDEWARSWGTVSINGLGESGFIVKDLPIDLTLGSRGVFNKSYISSVSTPSPYVAIDENNFNLVKTKNHLPYYMAGSFVAGMVAMMLLAN